MHDAERRQAVDCFLEGQIDVDQLRSILQKSLFDYEEEIRKLMMVKERLRCANVTFNEARIRLVTGQMTREEFWKLVGVE